MSGVSCVRSCISTPHMDDLRRDFRDVARFAPAFRSRSKSAFFLMNIRVKSLAVPMAHLADYHLPASRVPIIDHWLSRPSPAPGISDDGSTIRAQLVFLHMNVTSYQGNAHCGVTHMSGVSTMVSSDVCPTQLWRPRRHAHEGNPWSIQLFPFAAATFSRSLVDPQT
jgi:hypothetical protein